VVAEYYHGAVAMTLRLNEEVAAALREQADVEGISMNQVALKALAEYFKSSAHRDRVLAAGRRVVAAHGEALERLGQ
jgi:hypothetical protein